MSCSSGLMVSQRWSCSYVGYLCSASIFLCCRQYNMTPITAFGGNREGKNCAVTADALWSGSKGDWGASTDSSCLAFGYEWWWNFSARACDLFPLKCLVLCKSEHSEHCGYGTALPGFSTHLCSPWASHAPHQSFFSGKWSKKVTNVWLCLILTKPLYEMQYEDREGSTCVATHAATLAPDSEKERPSLQGQVKDAANCSQWEPWVYNEKELLRGLQHLCSISHQFSEVQGQVGSAGARLLLNLPPILVLPQFFGLKFLIIWFLLFIPLSALDIMSQFMLGNLSLFVSWDHKLI